MPEDLVPLIAIGTDEIAHVLDDPQDRNLQLLEHLEPFARIDEAHVLRRRHDNHPRHAHHLGHRKLRITGTRRQIDDEIVQLSPLNISGKLADELVHHRTSPDDRTVGIREKAHRDHLHSMTLERQDLIVLPHLGLALDAKHHRHARAEYIRIDQADSCPGGLQREGQVDRGRRLSDPALAAGHRDNILHPGQRRTAGRICLASLRGHLHIDLLGPGNPRALGKALHLQLLFYRAGRCGQLDLEGDLAAINDQVLDETQADNVTIQVRVLDRAKNLEYRIFVENIARHNSLLFELDTAEPEGARCVAYFLPINPACL